MAENEAESEWKRLQSPGTPTNGIKGGDLASSASVSLAPTHYLHRVTGTAAQVLMDIPYAGFAGTICLVPTAVWTWTSAATGAGAVSKGFGLAGTAVVGKANYFTFDPVTDLWYPSYIA
jgi:hypothetical protein